MRWLSWDGDWAGVLSKTICSPGLYLNLRNETPKLGLSIVPWASSAHGRWLEEQASWARQARTSLIASPWKSHSVTTCSTYCNVGDSTPPLDVRSVKAFADKSKNPWYVEILQTLWSFPSSLLSVDSFSEMSWGTQRFSAHLDFSEAPLLGAFPSVTNSSMMPSIS